MRHGLNFIVSLLFLTSLSAVAEQDGDPGADFYLAGEYDKAAAHWQPLADEGEPVAQHNLGVIHRDGLGSYDQDLGKAATLFMRSAQAGYVPAMVSLAEVQDELGNEPAANSWLTLAARWGNVEAIDYLKERGQKVPKADLYLAATGELQLAKMRATGDLIRPPIRQNNIPTPRTTESDR